MALRFMDGFDQYTTSTNVDLASAEPGLWTGGSSANNDIETGRGGVGKQYLAAVANQWLISKVFGHSGGTVIIGFWWDPTATATAVKHVIGLVDSGAVVNVNIAEDGSGNLVLNAGAGSGTILSTCTTPMVTAGQYVECKVLFSDTVGTCDWQVNGAAAGSDTTLDTIAAGGVADCVRLVLGSSVGGSFQCNGNAAFDDLYVADGSGSDLTDFAGDVVVDTQMAVAETGTITFTPSGGSDNALMVDEIGPDDDSTYNEANTVTDDDLLTIADPAATGQTVYALAPFAYARKVDAGARGLGVKIERGGSESTPTDQVLSTTYGYIQEIEENDPNGGGDWTVVNANAATFGYEITS